MLHVILLPMIKVWYFFICIIITIIIIIIVIIILSKREAFILYEKVFDNSLKVWQVAIDLGRIQTNNRR
jgi:hypothetical protein